jgi:phosphoribosylamine---glycine ligase
LENDLVELLDATIDGNLKDVELRWKSGAAVCVVMASQGYPGSYARGKTIRGLAGVIDLPCTKVFHAGTRQVDTGDFVTSGGRVLGVTAWAETLFAARQAAYFAVDKITFDGAHYRRDIGAKALP